jgi:hypothetical protein
MFDVKNVNDVTEKTPTAEAFLTIRKRKTSPLSDAFESSNKTTRRGSNEQPLISTLTTATPLGLPEASEDAEQTHRPAIVDNPTDVSLQHDLQEDPSEHEVPRLTATGKVGPLPPGTVSTTRITTITITPTTLSTPDGKNTSNTSTDVNTTHLNVIAEVPHSPALNRRTPSVLTPREATTPCEVPSELDRIAEVPPSPALHRRTPSVLVPREATIPCEVPSGPDRTAEVPPSSALNRRTERPDSSRSNHSL